MLDCKSGPDMTESDLNQGAFQKLADSFLSAGCHIVNPASPENLASLSQDDPNFAQKLFLRNLTLLTNRGSASRGVPSAEVTEIVFLPPAHSLESTADQPVLKDWAMCPDSATLIALALSFQLNVEFSQASEQAEGTYKLEPLSKEDVKSAIVGVMKELQKDYGTARQPSVEEALEMPGELAASTRMQNPR
jgi:hypothetical protein